MEKDTADTPDMAPATRRPKTTATPVPPATSPTTEPGGDLPAVQPLAEAELTLVDDAAGETTASGIVSVTVVP